MLEHIRVSYDCLFSLLCLHVADIHFVDASRYSEQPISTVKSLFRYWLHKAAWHRPSILILDNLDKLLGAEVEVRVLELLLVIVTHCFFSMQTRSALGI